MCTRIGVFVVVAASLIGCSGAVPFMPDEKDQRKKYPATDAGPPPPLEVSAIGCGPSRTSLPPPPYEVATDTVTREATGTWTKIAPMNRGRRNAFAHQLADGRVLVAAGTYINNDMTGDELTAGVELYDRSRDVWTLESEWPSAEPPVAIAMLSATRMLSITATSDTMEARARVYDVSTHAWSVLASPPGEFYGGSTLTPLQNGDLLLLGGRAIDGFTRSALRYEVKSNTWRRVAPMQDTRSAHRALLLADGRVIVMGGSDTRAHPIEIYDPKSNTWAAPTKAMESYAVLWEYESAFITADNRVLVPGRRGTWNGTRYAFAVLDIACLTWVDAMYLPAPLESFALARLPTTQFALVGGAVPYEQNTYATPIYDATAREFRFRAPLPARRLDVTAIGLDDGTILAFGGTDVACGTTCFAESRLDAWLLKP